MAKILVDDCFLHDNRLLLHCEAIAQLRARTRPLVGPVRVALAQAGGRVLAEAPVARQAVPAHTNSAVDGYAFAHAAYLAAGAAGLPIAGRAAAGRPIAQSVAAGDAVRILTGAVMPSGLDSVAMQEDCTLDGEGGAARVVVPEGLKRGANVREAGEDVALGETLLESGHVLRPQDLAALASIGIGEVAVRERLKVAVVSTGDEVIPAGARSLAPGEVYDANAPMLATLAALAGADVTQLGIWPDRPEVIRARLAEAAAHYHVILTSGGASQGEEDHMAAAIAALGQRHLWRLAIKPGRPIMFGQIGDAVLVGLPGNPVAVFVCFLMYVFPLLRALGGAPWAEPTRFQLPAAFAIGKRKTGRREFFRGMLTSDGNGRTTADKYARDGSGLISGLRAADALIEVGEDVSAIAPGDLVDVIPFTAFGIPGR